MKKTDEYYQALEVCNNAKDYHNMDVMVARTYVRAYDEAINYSQCCTELPNKMVIELSDEEMQIVSTEELIQMEKEAMEFDGFEGWIVRGKAAILK